MCSITISVPRMADEWRLPGIVHGVGQIPGQHHVELQSRQLPNPEGPAQHAHVRVHAHHHNILDPVRRTETVDLITRIADAIKPDDIQPGVLPVEDSHGGADDRVIARRLGDVHRQFRFDSLVAVTPPLQREGRLDLRRQLHAIAIRCSLVKIERPARRMDDHRPVTAGSGEYRIHPRDHLPHPLGRQLAVVVVPHITDDENGFGRLPFLGRRNGFDSSAARRLFDSAAGLDEKPSWHYRPDRRSVLRT